MLNNKKRIVIFFLIKTIITILFLFNIYADEDISEITMEESTIDPPQEEVLSDSDNIIEENIESEIEDITYQEEVIEENNQQEIILDISDSIPEEPTPIYYDVPIRITDVAGNAISDVKISINSNENEKIEWTSSNDIKIISLQSGIYTIHIDNMPNENIYIPANDITFEIKENGEITISNTKVDEINIINGYKNHSVIITNVDINNEIITGSELIITGHETGTENDITPILWHTDKTEKIIDLKPGTYSIHENSVSDTQVYEPSSDINFTVDIYGNVEIDNVTVEKITITNDYLLHNVTISKTDTEENEINGAILRITSEPDGVTTYSWKSGSDGVDDNGNYIPHTVSLKPGDYILHEMGVPVDYILAEDIYFTILTNGHIKINDKEVEKIIMIDKKVPTLPSTGSVETLILESISLITMMTIIIFMLYITKRKKSTF